MQAMIAVKRLYNKRTILTGRFYSKLLAIKYGVSEAAKKISATGVFISFYSLIVFSQPAANSLLPKVDKRVELVSIACKLASINGFSDTLNTIYSKAIYDHFTPYLKHPFIDLLRELKDKLDTTYWEIPALAVHLSQPPGLVPLVSFDDIANADRWESRELFNLKFVTLLQQFYKVAQCEAFFKSQEAYYGLVNQQCQKQVPKLNKVWIRHFLGLNTTENYYAIIGLGMRNGAYMRVNFKENRRNTFTIFACTSFKSNGIPGAFTSQTFSEALLHEYIHTFTNQLVDKNITALQEPSETILGNPEVFKLVENTFYGNWQYLLYESFVRACYLKYLVANTAIKADAEKEITAQEKAGFTWIREFIKELDNYEANRKLYKNLDAYMPRLIIFFKRMAEEMKNKPSA